MAIKVYERVPANSLLKRNAQIQLATDLDAVDRTDEGIKILKVVADDPKDLEAIMALGTSSVRARSSPTAETPTPRGSMPGGQREAELGVLLFPGHLLERSKQWAKAEVDLKKR
jgi:hypothetical protein